MWVFTCDGFFSVVHQDQYCGDDDLVVRSRAIADLERFLAEAPSSANGEPPAEILEFVGTDYAFRVVVKRSTWADYLAQAARNISYESFKDTVSKGDPARGATYREVWARLWEWQQTLVGDGTQ